MVIHDIAGFHDGGLRNNSGPDSPIRNLVDLPNDLFLLILSFLSSEDAVVCRAVCRTWLAAFTTQDVSRTLMKLHFPRTRELRMTARVSVDSSSDNCLSWAAVLAKVARRYHYLRAAKPRLVQKIDDVVREGTKHKHLYRGVEPWDRCLRFDDTSANFQYRDPTWCLDDGLLIYMDGSGKFLAYDLETRQRFTVPFDGDDKTVRRLRLDSGVLVVEWCERVPHHQLNDRETVHRHFATAFDVRRGSARPSPSSKPYPPIWDITFRSEWKIHFLGLPISRHDRFSSAHNGTHYALYLWQPNRSAWGEEDPLEQLTVWDISSPSVYRPSLDPIGANKPDTDLGPVVVRRLTWRDLDFLFIRQRHVPCIREILLDEANIYIHEEEHRWLAGLHASLSPPRNHHVRCTGIPIKGFGPRWFDHCCADGDVHMSFCSRSSTASRFSSSNGGTGSLSSLTTDNKTTASWPGQAACWRHEEFPYLTVSEMVDAAAGIRIVARQCFMMEALSIFVLPRISVEDDLKGADDDEVHFADDMWGKLLGKGCIRGDERWLVGEDGDGRVTIVRF